MRNMPGYLADFDDSFDNTFASWIFSVPDKWKSDFLALIEGRVIDVSAEYKDQIKLVYPKLADQIDSIFKVE